jgi:rSAM/selenodomain-associated transferase 1
MHASWRPISPDRRRPVLVVMAKSAVAGRVKTRLARDVGTVAAAWWYRHQLRRALRRLRDPRWTLVLAPSPDTALRRRTPGLAVMPQGGGDLGARMLRALHRAGPGPALVIGADIPGATPAEVWRAFRALARADVVLGPATDGGYWAIGLSGPRALRRDALAGVRWSTQHALADTRAALRGRRLVLAGTLSDVDTAADLAAIQRAAIE